MLLYVSSLHDYEYKVNSYVCALKGSLLRRESPVVHTAACIYTWTHEVAVRVVYVVWRARPSRLRPHHRRLLGQATRARLRVYDDSCAIAHKMEETQRVLQALGAGPALPDRFNPLERLLETAVKSVRLKSTPEVQMSGILALCEEMQRILKIAFMGTLGGRSAAIYL